MKLFAQVVLIAFRRGSGQLQCTYSGVLPTGPAKHDCYQPCFLPNYGYVRQEVLDLVRGLDKDPFTRLLINWYRRAKGKYKVPTFAHQELDLHKVFWEVQDKGGYDQVTTLKLWKVAHYHIHCCTFYFRPALSVLSQLRNLSNSQSHRHIRMDAAMGDVMLQ